MHAVVDTLNLVYNVYVAICTFFLYTECMHKYMHMYTYMYMGMDQENSGKMVRRITKGIVAEFM